MENKIAATPLTGGCQEIASNFLVNKKTCSACGGENIKTGKLHCVASLQSLDARTGLNGSDLHLSFCADCGEVIGIKVANPDKIK